MAISGNIPYFQTNPYGEMLGSVSKPTLYPCSSHENSWVNMDVHHPKNCIFIGIDPYPYYGEIWRETPADCWVIFIPIPGHAAVIFVRTCGNKG